MKISRFWNDYIRYFYHKTTAFGQNCTFGQIYPEETKEDIQTCLTCKVNKYCKDLNSIRGLVDSCWGDLELRFNTLPSWNKVPREIQLKIKVWYLKWLIF